MSRFVYLLIGCRDYADDAILSAHESIEGGLKARDAWMSDKDWEDSDPWDKNQIGLQKAPYFAKWLKKIEVIE